MAQKTDAALITQSDVIRDEVTVGANTKDRVATMFDDIIDSKANNTSLAWRGAHAGTTTLPSTGGNGPAGVPRAGDEWYFTNQVTIGSNIYLAGTLAKAKITTPTTEADWLFLQPTIQTA